MDILVLRPTALCLVLDVGLKESLVLLMESSFVVRGSVIDLGLVLTLIGT